MLGCCPRNGGALPYVGGYRLPVISPLFYAELTQRPPFFLHLWRIWHKSFKSLARFARTWIILKNSIAIFHQNLQIVTWNCVFTHLIAQIFWELTQKKDPLFEPTPKDPLFFQRKKAPYFRTCTSLSCLSNSPPPDVASNFGI